MTKAMQIICFTLSVIILSCNLVEAQKITNQRLLYNQYACNHTKGYISDLYYAIKPDMHAVKDKLSSVPGTILHGLIGHTMYGGQKAQVRFADDDELGTNEQIFLQQRKHKTHMALTNLLGTEISLEKQPRVAFCFSGGGFRSMVWTLGSLIAAEENGLLDCVTYMAGLSGSTWLMAPYLASKKSLKFIRDNLAHKIDHGLAHLVHHSDRMCVIRQLLAKAWHGQFMSAVDIYGPLVANTLLTDLGDKKLTATLSNSHEYIIQGRTPMPIYTAISANRSPNYDWVEFTPFEAGSSYLKAYIPTWAYGRKFKHGASTNYAPELPLGYLLGVFGSAFEVNMKDIIRQNAESIAQFKEGLPYEVAEIVDVLFKKFIVPTIGNVRLAPSMLPNPTYKTETRPLSDHKKLCLIDAGLDCNIPMPPLLRAARNIDVIIVYDASAGRIGSEIKRAAEYAQREGIAFPPVPDNAGKEPCTILRDENNPLCPIIVYLPRIKEDDYSTTFDPEKCIQDDYCSTFNFEYNDHNVQELCGLAEFSCHRYLSQIKSAIKSKIRT